ncbi:SoxR reducing system RseC family protein [Vibrio methylphosphonaticus]|uniref:SoxR reducing system RseC family protein n=1 Tax=Vibrio methylphosphonaticus TaxID=2946866 RepID=UPI002029BA4B|nr:SoxR reducing system RseC family protein [Vibrio methylphosphonaticus]MCL9773463.1 SoxR reducing system RseC family protein [Vibrio methylphosphonaticus]
MMTALATVTSVEKQGRQLQIQLSCEQQTSCSSCASKNSCGTGIVSKAVGSKALIWHLLTDEKVQSGDVVEIGFPEKSLLQSAALVYLLPLFFLFIGAGLGQRWFAPLLGAGEGVVILSAAAFAFWGFLLARKFIQPIEQTSSQEVVLIRILGQPIV